MALPYAYTYIEPAVTMDAIARIAGAPVYVKNTIRVDDTYYAAGSVTYSSGPYLLQAFLLHPGHGNKTSTLGVYVDGGGSPIHSKLCTVAATNTNWLVGLVAGTSFSNAVGSLFAASSIKLEWSASHWYSWQLLQFDTG